MKKLSARKKTSPDERRGLCQQWKTSGLSQSEFCRQHGIALSSFHQWLSGRRLGGVRSNLRNSQDWIPVEVKNTPGVITEEPLVIEIVLPNKMTLKLPISYSKINLVIEQLSHANTTLR